MSIYLENNGVKIIMRKGFPMQTARNLRLLRHLRGYTLEDLSKKAGISVSYLSRLESGSRNLSDDILLKLAKHLECEPEEIASDGPPEKQLEALGLPSFRSSRLNADRADGSDGKSTADLTSMMEEISQKLQKSVELSSRKLPIFAASMLRKKEEPTNSIDSDSHESEVSVDASVPIKQQPSDWLECPPELRNVKGAFGFFVADEDMQPKYNPGDIVLIHPSKPITLGCSVLAITNSNAIMVRQFKGWSGENFVLSKATEFNHPMEELQSPKNVINPDNLRGIYRIVSSRESS